MRELKKKMRELKKKWTRIKFHCRCGKLKLKLVDHKSYNIPLRHRRYEVSSMWKNCIWSAMFNFSMSLRMYLYIPTTLWKEEYNFFSFYSTRSIKLSTTRFLIANWQQSYDKMWLGAVTMNVRVRKNLKSNIPNVIDNQNYSLLISIIHTKANVGKLVTNSQTLTWIIK